MDTTETPMEKPMGHSHHELASMADTIMRAHEHMADPELMKKLQPHLDKKIGAIKSIADLKRHAKKLAAKSEMNEPGEGSKKEEASDTDEA